jgi:predicted nucleic acid-binding protein
VIVVSDSSPLIGLARIQRLSLLSALFERILIPTEVHHEVTVAARGLPGAEEVRAASWIEVGALRGPREPALERACERLGTGERGAILLAKSLSADLALLDEWKARRIAQTAGLSVAGCLGVLEAGNRLGLVPDLCARPTPTGSGRNPFRSQASSGQPDPARTSESVGSHAYLTSLTSVRLITRQAAWWLYPRPYYSSLFHPGPFYDSVIVRALKWRR